MKKFVLFKRKRVDSDASVAAPAYVELAFALRVKQAECSRCFL